MLNVIVFVVRLVLLCVSSVRIIDELMVIVVVLMGLSWLSCLRRFSVSAMSLMKNHVCPCISTFVFWSGGGCSIRARRFGCPSIACPVGSCPCRGWLWWCVFSVQVRPWGSCVVIVRALLGCWL